jgi:hypothetical protein
MDFTAFSGNTPNSAGVVRFYAQIINRIMMIMVFTIFLNTFLPALLPILVNGSES